MSYLTIVRHGQTPYNLRGLVQSRTDGELTDLGVEMAEKLGRRLQEESFTRIYSSDLNRCKETTAALMGQIRVPLPDVQFTSLLRERDYGDWEFQPGRLIQEKMEEMGLPDHKRHWVPVPNGEPYEETVRRASRFFSEICELIDEGETESENILAVTHGIFLMCLMDHITGNPSLYDLRNVKEGEFDRCPANACRTRLRISKLEPVENNNRVKRVITFTHIYDDSHVHN